MAYPLPFDVDCCSQYPNDCKDDCINNPYDSWLIENSFSTVATNAYSPTTASSLSSRYSLESTFDSFGGTRRSSIVSPSVSLWSDDAVTPPVTPQRNSTWCSSTPFKLAFGSSTNPAFRSQEPIRNYTLEEDSLWVPNDLHLPLLPSATPKTSTQYQNRAINCDARPAAFNLQTSDPALSRQIFSDPGSNPHYQGDGTYRPFWPPNALVWATPQTIAPKATVQSLLPSSPLPEVQMEYPYKTEAATESNMLLLSSPPPIQSPYIVPSQNSVENPRLLPGTVVSVGPIPQPALTRRLGDRGSRRQQHRKALVSMACRPRRPSNDFSCDNVIPQNTFACTFPDCIDKSTGKQKRFKRQEHRKRHEVTVHKGEKRYFCWVPGCATGFNRTDNLKNHIKTTHGKNNPAQRNRYVATLDASSKYYDPLWQGDLTDDGYPMIEGVRWCQCWVPECEKQYHLGEKLKAHLLQHHGKKSSPSDALYVATLDENSDSFDPAWEDKVKQEVSPSP